MLHNEFRIGEDFWCNARRWRCTDTGTRTIAAICLDRGEVGGQDGSTKETGMADAEAGGGFKGPPYAVQEHVFDEEAIIDCSATPDEPIILVLPTFQERIQLSPKATARIWREVRRGGITDVEGYVIGLLDRALTKKL